MSSQSDLKEKRDLLSYSTILIITAFLCGMLLMKVAPASIQQYVFYSVPFGLVAYLGLGVAARLRNRHAARTASRNAINRLEQRMEDHVRNVHLEGEEEADERRELPVAS